MSAETRPTVHEAWAAVMADVRSLGKDQTMNAPGQRFNFRGVDDVMNAVGPALRKHGVAVVPTIVELRHRDVQTSSGKPSREATVVVSYTIYGPAGDTMPGGSAGESMDSGDKGTAKAMSVALRVFYLQALCLPTHDTDPDHEVFERAPQQSQAELDAQATANGLAAITDPARLNAGRAWSEQRELMAEVVTDDQGQQVTLGDLFARHSHRLTPEGVPA